ncbi:hypothetical protein [Streptomyces gilvosporeus]|uniref:hypothetical protein n=1 Tax=Streptomyces gilvosporeus TaxID=553510 RepID=UPI001F401697|nr:hypothetical protein [Streptomyces gilvosporeus]
MMDRDTERHPGPDPEAVHEAYSFVCLHCGYGWEEEYEIRHSTDESGQRRIDYYERGRRVPSPLTRAQCPACNRGPLRILRPGRVNSARSMFPWSSYPDWMSPSGVQKVVDEER